MARSLQGRAQLVNSDTQAGKSPEEVWKMQEIFSGTGPLKMGTSEEFARVARLLSEVSFDEQTICSAFRLGDMSDVARLRFVNIDQADISDQLRILVRLFLVLKLVPRAEVEQAFDE